MRDLRRKGWIRLYRKIEDNSMWLNEPFTRGQAWVDLLLLANHQDGYIRVAGERIKIKRGQVGWSKKSLAERWRWSRGKVQRFLGELSKMEHQIEQQILVHTTVITIINYDKYQKNGATDGHQIEQQTDTNNNVKNVKNEKNIRETSLTNKIKYLKEIPSEDITLFTRKYNVGSPLIREKAEDLVLYCESKGKRYKNYRALLMNTLKKDYGLRSYDQGEVSIGYGEMGGNKKIPKVT